MKYSELETPRLRLRPWRESDLEDFFAYCKNPHVGPAAGWPPHRDKEDSRKVLHHFMEQGDVWAIEDRQTRRVIGSFGLHKDRKRDNPNCRMIGYAMSEDFWGEGRMVEAVLAVLRYVFETLQLEMITVYHYPFNLRSRRVIEKCGFQYEGTLRRASLRYDGVVLDDVCYSLLREDYLSRKAEG